MPGNENVSHILGCDGTSGFDFSGVYDSVKARESLAYILGDGRRVGITFAGKETETRITETFEAESQNPVEMQHIGWQAIPNNFRGYVETRSWQR